nr:unnamed protein product [Haemonchus contortus]
MIYLISFTRKYPKNHPHIREIMLNYFDKDWKVAQSFRDLSNFSAMEQPAKANQEMGSAPKSVIFTSKNCYGLTSQPFAEEMAGE